MNTNAEPPVVARRLAAFWRIAVWGGAALLILMLLVAIQYYEGFQWDQDDLILTILILGIGGALAEVTFQITLNPFSRAGAIVAILTSVVVFAASVAVGMIGDEGDPVNLLFGVVLLVVVVGAWFSGLHPLILPAFMLAAGAIQAAIGLLAGVLANDVVGGAFTMALALLWWVSAGLFAVARKC